MLEQNADELDTFSSSRNVRIKDSVLFRGSIFCLRERIKHLQRIATPNATRDNTRELRLEFDGWRMGFDRMMFVRERGAVKEAMLRSSCYGFRGTRRLLRESN